MIDWRVLQIEQNLTYIKCGDYFIPNIRLKHTDERPIGKYGRMRRTFLEEHNPFLFNDMVLTETLFPHLWEIQQTCEKRIEQIMTDLQEKNPAPDKKTEQLAWVEHMNSLKVQAEELTVAELIYC